MRRGVADEAVDALELLSGRRLRLRARRAPRSAPAAGARAGRRAPRAPRRWLRAMRTRAAALAPRRRAAHLPAGRAGQVREPQPAARRTPARGSRLAARDRRRRRAARAASWTASCSCASASRWQLAQPAHRLNSHAAWPQTRRRAGQRRARDELRRDRPGDRVRRASPSRCCCRSPTCAWAGAWTPTGRRSRASTAGAAAWSTRSPIRHRAAPAAAAYSREAALDEARAFLAERPYLTAREAQRTLDDPPPLVNGVEPKGRGRGRVLPEPPRPGAGDLGPPPGARRARRRRRGARARAAPARAPREPRWRPGPRRRPATLASLAARAAQADPRRAARHLRALRLAAARALLRGVGSVGGARARRSRCGGCGARSRSS